MPLGGSLRPAVWMAGLVTRHKTREDFVITSNQGGDRMQSDTDTQLTSSFEEAPPRDFMTVMRGYDRQQVDEHIRQIEAEMRQHREHVQAMRQELSAARRQAHEQERPT